MKRVGFALFSIISLVGLYNCQNHRGQTVPKTTMSLDTSPQHDSKQSEAGTTMSLDTSPQHDSKQSEAETTMSSDTITHSDQHDRKLLVPKKILVLDTIIYSNQYYGEQVDSSTNLLIDTITYQKRFFFGEETSIHYIEMMYIYPKNDTLAARALASRFFPARLVAKTTSLTKLMKRYAKTIYKNAPILHVNEVKDYDEDGLIGWECVTDNELHYYDKHIISSSIRYAEVWDGRVRDDVGGITAFSIDRATGKVLKEADLFTKGYKRKLAKIIVSYLMTKHSVSSPSELKEYGYITPEEIAPNNNFYLTDNEIVYIYGKYEFGAPWTEHEIKISFDKLKPIIREDCVLKHYI